MRYVWITMLAVGAIGTAVTILNLRSPSRTPDNDGAWTLSFALSLALVAFGIFQLVDT